MLHRNSLCLFSVMICFLHFNKEVCEAACDTKTAEACQREWPNHPAPVSRPASNVIISQIETYGGPNTCPALKQAKECLRKAGCYNKDGKPADMASTHQTDMLYYACTDGQKALNSSMACLKSDKLGDQLIKCQTQFGSNTPGPANEMCKTEEKRLKCNFDATVAACNREAAVAFVTAEHTQLAPSLRMACELKNPANSGISKEAVFRSGLMMLSVFVSTSLILNGS